ncbi:hypothetical protein SOVF_102420 [Spinacia oleracea]|nr:hypothetical protein SOVF_102420 [Spinacia oleracea]
MVSSILYLTPLPSPASYSLIPARRSSTVATEVSECRTTKVNRSMGLYGES